MMDKRKIAGSMLSSAALASTAAAQIDELLYPLCKFDYDLMWLILMVAPAIVVFLIVYNGVKLQSDNENTRESGKKGIKNAIIGLILILVFALFGCQFVPGCVPCPLDPYTKPADPSGANIPLNIWIIDPVYGASIDEDTAINFECRTRGSPTSIIWSFNDPYGKQRTASGSCTTTYTYTEPGEYDVVVTAIDAFGNTAQHRIRVTIKSTAAPPPPPPPPGPSCSNKIQDGDEQGVDCGGPVISKCLPCPSCTDGIKNGDETGIDCGGSVCPACLPGCTQKPSIVVNSVTFRNQLTNAVVSPPLPSTTMLKVEVDYTCSATPPGYAFTNAVFNYQLSHPSVGTTSHTIPIQSYNCQTGPSGSPNTMFVIPMSYGGGGGTLTYEIRADIIDLNGPSNCGFDNTGSTTVSIQ